MFDAGFITMKGNDGKPETLTWFVDYTAHKTASGIGGGKCRFIKVFSGKGESLAHIEKDFRQEPHKENAYNLTYALLERFG